jgi:hypothetical protein
MIHIFNIFNKNTVCVKRALKEVIYGRLRKIVILFLFTIETIVCYAQINPAVYEKHMPAIIPVENQPADYKFTSHIANIKIPQNLADNWTTEIEQQYIRRLFEYIPDKQFVIMQYSGFYFPNNSGLTGAHSFHVQNDVQNIGLPTFDMSANYNSTKLLRITRLEDGWFIRPNIITHEIFHQWCSFGDNTILYWLVDPSNHTGLIDDNTSVFENHRNNFKHMQDNLYQYKQYSSRGYVSKIEGYLAGIWDMPDSLITLKNYRHTDITSMIYNSECECYDVINVQAEGIVTLYKNELYNLYGGKRNPDYLSCSKDYNSVVVVLSVNEFLDDNLLKAYHYGSIVLETEGTSSYYNSKYDEIFSYFPSGTIPDQYGTRQLNPYHATYGNLHFKTQLFSSSVTDATLRSLTVSSGNLLFDADTTNYTVNVANEVTSIDVIGTANHAAATVSGNVTGKTLDVGDNVVNITVTAEDGITIRTYTVTIHRISNDATLRSLTVSSGDLLFDANTTSYTVNVANEVTSIDVTGTANHDLATVSGNITGKSLNVGDNTVNITVTAEDGITTGIYTVTIHRLSADATLSSLTVSSGDFSFNANTTNYTVNVSNEVTSIDVIGTANHAAATVSGNVTGKSLEVGDNAVNITVTAEDGTVKTYTVTVVRADHVFVTEAELVNVHANGKETTVNGSTIEYVAACDETSFDLDLEASPYSTIMVDGEEYIAGQRIELAGEVTTANIQVKAETGGAQSNYTLKITAPLNDNRLYYRRWDDVLAINLNPANNGGYNVSEVHWYNPDGTYIGSGGYIEIQGSTNDYYAEIQTEGNRRRVCGTAETRSPEKIVVYPNPVPRGESVQLQLPETFVGGALNIYDMQGTLRKSGLPLPATNNSLNVSDLDTGIYLLHITGKTGEHQSVKIIIE